MHCNVLHDAYVGTLKCNLNAGTVDVLCKYITKIIVKVTKESANITVTVKTVNQELKNYKKVYKCLNENSN